MPKKPDRSKRRQPRKGFPFRVVGYVDRSTQQLVAAAADKVGENISAFVAKAARERAESILDKSNKT